MWTSRQHRPTKNKVSKTVYPILFIPREESGAQLYLPGTPIYRTPLHFIKDTFFYSEIFLCLMRLVPSNPANLQMVLLKFSTVVLCYFFHDVKFLKHWSSTCTWGLCKRKMKSATWQDGGRTFLQNVHKHDVISHLYIWLLTAPRLAN